AVAVAILVGGVAGASASSAGTPGPAAPRSDAGLFGTQDPTYDGVFRQSYALMGLVAADASIPRPAVNWLLDQQCDDGSFMSFRADTGGACPPSDPTTYSGPDTNSTAMALAALVAVGEDDAALEAATWLLAQQTRGGGFPYYAGGSPDTNSTGLAIAALKLVDGTSKQRRNAANYERRMAYGCNSEPDLVGSMPYMAGMLPESMSTTQSLLGLSRAFLVRERSQQRANPSVTCDGNGRVENVKGATARWIARALRANDGRLPDVFDPQVTDWNSTAVAIIGLVAARTGGIATDIAITALADNIDAYVEDGEGGRAGALGTAILAAVATGSDPRDFGGRDLVADLQSTR
ncbi:MAG: hypothetical protein VW239_05575, partial [Candidatus Nanopelagicales bacterium]